MMILYAPNINVGGGFVLLLELLKALPSGEVCKLYLDARIRRKISTLVQPHSVTWIAPKIFERWKAEKSLAKLSSSGDVIICFHGVPPMFTCKGQVIVYIQNRLLISDLSNYQFPLTTHLRLSYERMVLYRRCKLVDCYFVQTKSMKKCLENWFIKKGAPELETRIFVAPFAELSLNKYTETLAATTDKYYTFCYVADGQPHKNHMRLFQALRILAEQGLTPRLAITLGDHEIKLLRQCQILNEIHGTRIENLGPLDHHAVYELYIKSEALVFPSLIESFGLPLVEAEKLNLPIIASELDYVRDVCEPIETFNPTEPLSISRALRRFMDQREPLPHIMSAANFIGSLNNQNKDLL